MTREQVDRVILKGDGQKTELIETHISWVVLGERFAFKIKKPIKYSFLDFSTLELRRHYCEREVQLNKRFSDDIYLDVQPVKENSGRFVIGDENGEVVDYAVRMRKMDRNLQMDTLLQENKVTADDINKLAEKIARFHETARHIYNSDFNSFQNAFNDLQSEKKYLSGYLPTSTCAIIDQATAASNRLFKEKRELLETRLKKGFFRDCHGDLHARNIFLLPDPQPFDCIEFNEDFRAIDVLNEVAFLCMDLDAFARQDLSELFLSSYNSFLPAVENKEDYNLFIYYKMYRANVRAKVNSLRARSAINDIARRLPLIEAEKYLSLMARYLKTFDL
jgi:uncharacterized protein